MSIKLEGAEGVSVNMVTMIGKPGVARTEAGVHWCCRCEQPIGDLDTPVKHIKLLVNLWPTGAPGRAKQLFFCIPCWTTLTTKYWRAINGVVAESDTPDCVVRDWPGS